MKTRHPRIWIARDARPVLDGVSGTVLFTGPKPILENDGFWHQRNGSGRWPVPNVSRLKPGQILRVKITPLDRPARKA
jgi:hypothetical protein